jgi:hypothetical protein
MAQGTRPDGQIFASGAPKDEITDFPSIDRGWGVTVDGEDQDGNPVTQATGGIPPMEWDNGQRNKVDNNIWWLLNHAIPDWQTGTWAAGAFVTYDGWIYYNSGATDTTDTPAATGTSWTQIMPLSGLDDRYLQIDKNLSEIAAAGSEAQKAARNNIVAVGSVNHTEPDENGNVKVTFPVTSVNGETGAVTVAMPKTYGGVGTYVLAYNFSDTAWEPGSPLVPGSILYPSSCAGDYPKLPTAFSGSWTLMGFYRTPSESSVTASHSSLFMRVL